MHIIDSHAHLVPDFFPECPRGVPDAGWPSVVPMDDGRARLMINGKEYRVMARAYFDLQARLEFMEHEGISAQVISPLPELLGHWLSADTASLLAEITNQAIANTLSSAPKKIAGLGMLPLQDVERSLRMIPELSALGLRGIEVGSNVNGLSIADASFHPIFVDLAQRGLCVQVHGVRPSAPERQLGPKIMANVVGIPQDGATAISSFIATDILKRAPGLRLCFVHGGGTFGAVLDRMNFVWSAFPALGDTATMSPRNYVRRFFFDTVTYSAAYLRYLIHAFGVETLMCGTDGPGFGGQPDLEDLVREACDGDTACADGIYWRNALRFLGWSNPDDAPLRPSRPESSDS